MAVGRTTVGAGSADWSGRVRRRPVAAGCSRGITALWMTLSAGAGGVPRGPSAPRRRPTAPCHASAWLVARARARFQAMRITRQCRSGQCHQCKCKKHPNLRQSYTHTTKMDWSERYNTPLNHVFSRRHKLTLEWRVELALLKALGESGLVPAEAFEEAKAVVDCEWGERRSRKSAPTKRDSTAPSRPPQPLQLERSPSSARWRLRRTRTTTSWRL